MFLDHPVPFNGDEIWIMDGDGGDARVLVDDGADVYTWPRVSPDGSTVLFGAGDMSRIVAIEGCCGTPSGQELDAPSEPEPAWYGNDTLIVD